MSAMGILKDTTKGTHKENETRNNPPKTLTFKLRITILT